jgi:hypothetical protein
MQRFGREGKIKRLADYHVIGEPELCSGAVSQAVQNCYLIPPGSSLL